MSRTRTHRPATPPQSAGGRGTQQRIWESIRSRRNGFTKADLHSDSAASPGTIDNYVGALVNGGYVERAERLVDTNSKLLCYRLVRDNGIEHPRLTARGEPVVNRAYLGTEAVWRTLRTMADLTLREITAFASTPARPLAYITVAIYVGQLVKAGYVQRTGDRKTAIRHRLLKYTGPRPPVASRQPYLYDPNLDQVVWREESNDADA